MVGGGNCKRGEEREREVGTRGREQRGGEGTKRCHSVKILSPAKEKVFINHKTKHDNTSLAFFSNSLCLRVYYTDSVVLKMPFRCFASSLSYSQ